MVLRGRGAPRAPGRSGSQQNTGFSCYPLIPGGLRAPTRVLSEGAMVGDISPVSKKKSRVRNDGGSLIRP